MDPASLQYITDQNGHKTAVVVPIEEFHRLIGDDLYSKKELHADLIEGIRYAKNTPDNQKEVIDDIDTYVDKLENLSRSGL